MKTSQTNVFRQLRNYENSGSWSLGKFNPDFTAQRVSTSVGWGCFQVRHFHDLNGTTPKTNFGTAPDHFEYMAWHLLQTLVNHSPVDPTSKHDDDEDRHDGECCLFTIALRTPVGEGVIATAPTDALSELCSGTASLGIGVHWGGTVRGRRCAPLGPEPGPEPEVQLGASPLTWHRRL